MNLSKYGGRLRGGLLMILEGFLLILLAGFLELVVVPWLSGVPALAIATSAISSVAALLGVSRKISGVAVLLGVSRASVRRLRDGLLMILGGFLLGLIPVKLGLAGINGWLVGIPVTAGVIVGINGIAVLAELPILGAIVRVVLSYASMIVLAIILIGPMIWMLFVSLHPPQSPIPPLAETLPVVAKPVTDAHGKPVMVNGPDHTLVQKTEIEPDFHWENYDTVINSPTLPVRRFFLNTVFVTSMVVIFQLLITSLCAYGLSRLRFKGRDAVFALFIGSMMFAGPVTQIPVYLMLKGFGWLDTYWALIVPGVSSAFSVFLLRQFFLQIPFELDEAARIDGANDWTIYSRVILPLSKAALATAGAFTFFAVWTDFFGPLIYTNSVDMRTLEVGLSVFKGSYGNTNWPLQMTAALVVMAPLLIVFLFLQRYFTRGIMLGSIK